MALNIVQDAIEFTYKGLEFMIHEHFISRYRERVKKPQPDIMKTCLYALDHWKLVADEDKAARAIKRIGHANHYLFDPRSQATIALSLDKWQNRYTIFRTIYLSRPDQWVIEQAAASNQNFFGAQL